MATVKILYNDSAETLEKYLKEKADKDVPQTEHSCFLDGMTKEFSQVQSDHNSKGNNALHLIQSWSPQESKSLSPQKVHEMGVEMANRFAPGHQFVIQTHTDQPHFHNHIVINPVHMETGKRIQNKYENLYTLRDLNDTIAKEQGLSFLPRQETLRRSGPNEKARRIEAYRGRSYIVDLADKANFARGHATNYEEYSSILGSFNIDTRVENKNITYFYPGREVGKRGRNLDPALDKPGLEKKFAENREKFEKFPELRATPSHQTSTLTQAPGQSTTPDLQQSVIPLEEIKKAKTQSIFKYCEREKIRTFETEEGKTVLKGREHVELREYSWINHKNKTQGTLIDFVANHRSTSLLHAVSIINQNPNLMLLEKHLGEINRPYRSFIIPKGDSATRADAIRQVALFLNHKGPSEHYASLFKAQAIQVTRNNHIRFFSEKNQTGFLEYIPTQDGNYRKQIQGDVRSPFLNQRGKGSELLIYLDPRSLLKQRPNVFERDQNKAQGILALLEPNLTIAHQAIASQKNIKSVKIIKDPLEPQSSASSQFFEDLRQSLNPFSIDTSMAWETLSLEVSQQSRSQDLNTSPDFFNL